MYKYLQTFKHIMPRLGLYLCPKCNIPCIKEDGCYKHNEKRKEVSKRFYEKHKDELKARSKEYYEANKERVLQNIRDRKVKQQKERDPLPINDEIYQMAMLREASVQYARQIQETLEREIQEREIQEAEHTDK